MINYNFTRIFKARGIERPFSYLKKAGFSENFASKINKNNVKRLNLRELERLCILLKCTPNDFYEWIPEPEMQSDHEHALNAIRKSDKLTDLTQMLNAVPISKLNELEKIIKDNI